MKRSIITTKDGSHSILVEELGETYHSVHGALQEAQHVYIQNGLLFCLQPELHILEMGFGTGLNAFLTLKEAERRNIMIHYTSLEAHPVTEEEWEKLNYAANAADKNYFEKLHRAAWNTPVSMHPNFVLEKIHSKIQDFNPGSFYQLVYYDAFGFAYQPELWSEQIFQNIYNILSPQGVLVTYACKGEVTRILKRIGFSVEKLQGPPGKREMTRAVKS